MLPFDTILSQSVKRAGRINLKGYPQFYKSDFDIARIAIGATECILITPKAEFDLRTVVKMVQTLEEDYGIPCLVYAPKLSGYQRKRLAELGIAHIISPRNMSIQFLGVVLQDERRALAQREHFSPGAQHLALRIVERRWMAWSATEIAAAMNKSLPSVSNYFAEIKSAVPQAVEKNGTTSRIANLEGLSIGELFELFEPHITTPVKSSLYLKGVNCKERLREAGCVVAGFTALSQVTMLSDNSWQTLAATMSKGSFLTQFADFDIVGKNDDPDVQLEFWKYPPSASDSDTVDEVSLYLSLANTAAASDPRVEDALKTLRERISA